LNPPVVDEPRHVRQERAVKVFRVVLSVGGVVFVQADRFQAEGSMVRFYRGESVIAEYPCTSVKEDITEPTATQRIGLFAPKPPDESQR
jgi:hypothetical protein